MIHRSVLLKVAICLLLCLPPTLVRGAQNILTSPNGRLTLSFEVVDGTPYYGLKHQEGGEVIRKSRLGFLLVNLPALDSGFEVDRVDYSQYDQTWNPIMGEEAEIRNQYEEMVVVMKQTRLNDRRLSVRFRLYDDGLGFRYEFPNQPMLTHFDIKEELTEFSLSEDCQAYWIPGDYDSNEFCYNISSLSALPDTMRSARRWIDSKTLIDDRSVQTPLLLKKKNGFYINIHEAALVNFPAMALTLGQGAASFTFRANLAPDPVGNKGRVQSDFQTPWRTVIVSNGAPGIAESKLVLNLNEPTRYESTDWIRPMKYIGVWWEMFVPNGSSWSYTGDTNLKIDSFDYSQATPNGRHGARTENVRRYIDFAAKHGFDGVLVEGWNIGWEDWFDRRKERVFDYVTPYPDFDLVGLNEYAATKGVSLVMHHETSGSTINYERSMDRAYALMNRYGYKAVKTGYVGRLLPVGEYHYGQTFVNHINYSIQKAAEYKICVNAHESPRPTGLHRTYPNYLACESARGTEYEGFSFLNPNHCTILPFTRLIGGPMDYTPGIFQTDFSYYDSNNHKRMATTLTQQLALYVVIYSPFQMAADLPENYERFEDAFQFIKEVPVDWKHSRVLEALPGEYVTVARQSKKEDEWFVGGICNEKGRKTVVSFDFLDKGTAYEAVIYRDGPDGGRHGNPQSYRIERMRVNSKSKVSIELASCGGFAISIRKR